MITNYLDDIAVGDRHVSRSRTITETDIVTFAMFTGDWHPLHTVVEYAEADERFGQRIAHGALVLSVALGLVEFRPEMMKAFYGIDKLRFVAPTFIGDTLHVETEVIEVTPRGPGTVWSLPGSPSSRPIRARCWWPRCGVWSPGHPPDPSRPRRPEAGLLFDHGEGEAQWLVGRVERTRSVATSSTAPRTSSASGGTGRRRWQRSPPPSG